MSLPVDGDNCANPGSYFTYIGNAEADKFGNGSISSWKNVNFDSLIGKSVQMRGRYGDYGIPRITGQPDVTLPLDPDGITAVTPATRTYASGHFRTLDVQACGNIVEIECPSAVHPSTHSSTYAAPTTPHYSPTKSHYKPTVSY